jgi:hypothetical protein
MWWWAGFPLELRDYLGIDKWTRSINYMTNPNEEACLSRWSLCQFWDFEYEGLRCDGFSASGSKLREINFLWESMHWLCLKPWRL